MYTVKEYLNSSKDPFGLTIKGKSKSFKEAQKTFQASIINGKTFSTNEGKFKVSDLSHNKGIKNAILQFREGGIERGDVELKVYDTNMDKKKGATIEIRKTSGSDYDYVEKLKEAVTCILDKFLGDDDVDAREKEEKKLFKCDICDWQTRHEPALKGHSKRMHKVVVNTKKNTISLLICKKCKFETKSRATLMVHERLKHKDERLKRTKSIYNCKDCNSTFDGQNKLNEHIRLQHEGSKVKCDTINSEMSLSSSPPRKRLEKLIEEETEMLDLDEMEIKVEEELNVRILLEERIKDLEAAIDKETKKVEELEILVTSLLDEKNQNEEIKLNLMRRIEVLTGKNSLEVPKHLFPVHERHLPLLKGFKMMYKTLGNGRCLENSVAVHILENEEEGISIKKKVNNHMADHFESFYQDKITLPYEELIGVKGTKVKIESKEEMIEFLRSKKSLSAWSNCQELSAVANLFNINIHIFTYEGKHGWWSQVCPDPEMASFAEFNSGWAPDIYLHNSSNTHYDLLVKEESRLANAGLVGKTRSDELEGNDKADLEKVLLEEEKGDNEPTEIDEELILFSGKSNGFRRQGPQTYAEVVKSQQMFKCNFCDSKLESQGLLNAHMSIHKVDLIVCDVCDSTFKSKSELEEHIIKAHGEEWNCNDCPFQTNEPSLLIKHLKIAFHQPSSNLGNKKKKMNDFKRCYTCDMEVDGYVSLMNHRLESHPSNKKCRKFPEGTCTRGKNAGMFMQKI